MHNSAFGILALALAEVGFAAAPPAEPTAEQLALGQQRVRLARRMAREVNANRLDEVGALCVEVLRLERRLFGEVHPAVERTLGILAALEEARGRWGKAIAARRQSVEVAARLYGPEHWRVVDARRLLLDVRRLSRLRARPRLDLELAGRLDAEAMALYAQGKAKEAVPLFERAMRLRQGVQGERHPRHADSLNNLALVCRQMGEHETALQLFEKALAVRKEVQGEGHPDYATNLANVAAVYRDLGRYRSALPLLEGALRSMKEARGERHPSYANLLNNLGMLHKEMGRHARALPLLRQAMRVRREALGEEHPHYGHSLNNLASLYQAMGDRARALALFRRALRVRRKALGETHPDVAESLNNLALLYRDMAEHSRALPLYRQALELLASGPGRRHPGYATSLNNLAMLHEEMGDLNQALLLCRQAMRLREEGPGKGSPAWAESANSLASIYQARGDHARALPLFQGALKMRKEVLGESHPDYAESLHSLAALYQDMGEHSRAFPLLRQAVRLRREIHGARSPRYVLSLSSLASLYRSLGQHSRALPLYREVRRLAGAVHGAKHFSFATSLHNLAGIHHDLGNHPRALALYREALLLHREILGEKHPEYAKTLNNLALVHWNMGDDAKALSLYRRTLRLTREALGENHPYYADGLKHLALLLSPERRSAALPLSAQALALELRHLQDSLGVVDERQRLTLLERSSMSLSLFLSLAESELPAGEIYPWVLGLKGVGASRARWDALARDNPDLAPVLLELQSARAGLARLANDSTAAAASDWRSRFDGLEARKRSAQERLSRAGVPFARPWRTPTAAVAAALPEGAALVEFLSYDHVRRNRSGRGWEWERRLLAFVLHPRRPAALVRLGRARLFEGVVRAWRRSLLSGREPDPAASAWLRARLWLPVEARLGGVQTVLIAPDGELANLPFAALPGKKPGSFLIEERAFVALSSGRQLLDVTPGKPGAGLLVLGGASFGPPGLGERSWPELPGAAVEAGLVRRLFRARYPSAPTCRLSGPAATREQLLRALAGGKHRWRRLHLATHGYFEPARPGLSPSLPVAGAVASAAGPAGRLQALAGLLALEGPDVLDRRAGFDPTGRTERISGRNPMLAAGLVLAGANRTGADGVLTAEEISGLDLRGCELAVLSACETALGKQEGYQGVQGLQRAFHDAGAGSLVASLWSVSDAATSLLMEEFYRRLWGSEKLSKAEALRRAQLFVLNNPDRVTARAKELRAHLLKWGCGEAELESRGLGRKSLALPRTAAGKARGPVAWWAGFILSGDGR
jgi:CHAT domain-containing protein/tetratricopeptide (TPR) repeat protein